MYSIVYAAASTNFKHYYLIKIDQLLRTIAEQISKHQWVIMLSKEPGEVKKVFKTDKLSNVTHSNHTHPYKHVQLPLEPCFDINGLRLVRHMGFKLLALLAMWMQSVLVLEPSPFGMWRPCRIQDWRPTVSAILHVHSDKCLTQN